MEETTNNDSPQFYITAVRKGEAENEILVDYQLTDEFKQWYKTKNNLKRWSRKRFENELTEMVKLKMAQDIGSIETVPEPPTPDSENESE